MNVYQVLECYGEDTSLITTDLNLVLQKIKNIVSDEINCTLQVTIWDNGSEIFESAVYNEEDGDIKYEDIYNELMQFVNKQDKIKE